MGLKMPLIRCLALSAWALAFPAAAAPFQFHFDGEMRARIETIDHQARAGFVDSETLFNLRTTLNLAVTNGALSIGGSLIDSRVYDPAPRSAASTNEVNAIEPVRAWAAYDLSGFAGKGSNLHLLGGRFTMDVGSRRLIANDDYRNTTNGFTGAKADWTLPHGWSGTGFLVLPQTRLPDDGPAIRRNAVALDREGTDLRLAGLFVARALGRSRTSLDATVYRLDEQDTVERQTRNRHLTSITARIVRTPAPGKLHFEAEYIHQGGAIRTSTLPAAQRLRVDAWFAHASVGYTLPLKWQPRVTLEYDQASGDHGGGSYNRFDSLFGMRRADLGPAGLYFAVGRTNIATPAVRLEVTPGKRLDAFVAWRGLWLASASDAFSSTGALQIWQIAVEDSTIITVHGQFGHSPRQRVVLTMVSGFPVLLRFMYPKQIHHPMPRDCGEPAKSRVLVGRLEVSDKPACFKTGVLNDVRGIHQIAHQHDQIHASSA